MSNDNWEDRFDAVVRETERNLAKVKGTLQETPSKYTAGSGDSRNILLELTPQQTRSAVNSSINYKTPKQHSTPHNNYQKQLWKQEDEISKLRKQIALLEQSKIHYEQESRLLKSQVVSLKNRSSRPATPDRPREGRDYFQELEKFKSEMFSEMRRIKQDVGLTRVEPGGLADKEIRALRKDLDASRVRYTEDIQEIRNDLETLRNRMVKVELEVHSAMTDCKECSRKCQRIENEVAHVSEGIRLQNRSTSTQLQALNDSCAHLSVVRSSVSDMEGRLSSLECMGVRLSRNESNTPASRQESITTRGSSYGTDIAFNKNVLSTKPDKLKVFNDLDVSLDDLSLLSDEEEITLDLSQLSDTGSTYKPTSGAPDLNISQMSDLEDKYKGKDITESLAETISVADDLISGISEFLSDNEAASP